MPGQESDLAQALIELAPLKHAPVPVKACEFHLVKAAFLIEITGNHTGSLALSDGNVLPPTGRALKLTISEFWKFTEGKVSEYRVIYDRIEFLAQIGIDAVPAAQ